MLLIPFTIIQYALHATVDRSDRITTATMRSRTAQARQHQPSSPKLPALADPSFLARSQQVPSILLQRTQLVRRECCGVLTLNTVIERGKTGHPSRISRRELRNGT